MILALGVVVFRWAVHVSNHLDASRMLVTEKVFGFLVAALAVQLVLNGLSDVGVIHLTSHGKRTWKAQGREPCSQGRSPCIEVRWRIAVVMWLQTASISPGGGRKRADTLWCGYEVAILPSMDGPGSY